MPEPEKEEVGQIVLKTAKSQGLVISRVPKPTRDAFMELAESEFADDFGMTLKAIFDGYVLWRVFFQNMDMKLDKLLEISERKTNTQPLVKKKLLSGREINKKEESK